MVTFGIKFITSSEEFKDGVYTRVIFLFYFYAKLFEIIGY